MIIHYNTNKDAAEKSVQHLKSLGVQAAAVQGDALKTTFGTDLINATTKLFPNRSIDILINNAGHAVFHENVQTATVEEFDAIFHANVRAPFLLLQAALPHLTSPGARIINIGSVVSRNGTMFANLYSASKGAVNSMSLGWAEQLGPKGITVNVVSPGPTATDYQPPEEHPLVKKFRMEQYIKRDATPEEVATVVLFVAHPKNTFVTGQVLAVDGGLSYV